MTKTFGRYDRESATEYLARLCPLGVVDQKTHDRCCERERRKRDSLGSERFSTAPVTLPKLKFLEGKE